MSRKTPETIGRYRVLATIASGHLGSVYRAFDPRIDRQIAIKLVTGGDDELHERFARAARAAARLSHPHIVAIFDVGEHEGHPFVAMEYVEGETLAEIIGRKAPLTTVRRLELAEALVGGLAVAHQAGFLHGDIKPARLMVDISGALKILGVGIARTAEPSSLTGALIGTLNYMSPEQLAGQRLDHRSEIFSVGAVCYELFSYRQAFPGGLDTGVPQRVLLSQTESLAAVCPTLDAEIVRIVHRCLEADVRKRYPDLDMMRRDLERVRLPQATDESEITTSIGPPAPLAHGPIPAPSRAHFKGMLDRRRSEQIQEYLRHAADAYAAADYDTAIAESEQVLLLDAQERQAIDLRERARTALDERVRAEAESAKRRVETAAPRVPARALDENVQFTVYRPSVVAPGLWYPMLAFAHLAERRPDAPADEPDPVAEVRRLAQQALGRNAVDFPHVVQDSWRAIPLRGHLRFVPDVEGVEFNPPECSVLWIESVHKAEFRLQAAPALDGRVARGTVAVYLGHLLVAEVSVAIRVDRDAVSSEAAADDARPYQRIFASYSHLDTAIVEELEEAVQSLGHEYVRDATRLRSGEVWSERLGEMIATADVFQLFWSWNALQSRFVRAEWEHALALGRGHFIRPVYWEEPFPSTPELPPSPLRDLHFKHIRPLSAIPGGSSPAPGPSRQEEEAVRLRLEDEARIAEEHARSEEEEQRRAEVARRAAEQATQRSREAYREAARLRRIERVKAQEAARREEQTADETRRIEVGGSEGAVTKRAEHPAVGSPPARPARQTWLWWMPAIAIGLILAAIITRC